MVNSKGNTLTGLGQVAEVALLQAATVCPCAGQGLT